VKNLQTGQMSSNQLKQLYTGFLGVCVCVCVCACVCVRACVRARVRVNHISCMGNGSASFIDTYIINSF
jgi:hypothetical protein